MLDTPDRNQKALARLEEVFGRRIQRGQAIREQHGHTTSWIATQPPDAVFAPETVEEVQRVVTICGEDRMPLIPFGAGTSLEAQLNAPMGGLSLDMSGMNRILQVHASDLDAVVQPGVTRKQLSEYVRSDGLFFPIDPGADATLGGMCSTRASGTNAVRYGTMKQNVLATQVVLPDGRLIRTGSRARKSSAGYDLTSLLVGSEGTLGVITELTVRLHGLPERIVSGTCSFPTLDAAVQVVIQAIQFGLPVARIELMDPLCMRAVNAYSGLGLAEKPSLFVEFHGSEASVSEQVEAFSALCEEQGADPFRHAERPEDRSSLWQARHDIYFAFSELRRGVKGLPTDVCVPISRLAECIIETNADMERSGLLAPCIGHVGDGNFHLMVLVDPEDSEEMARCHAAVDRLNERAIAMDGTCTGEHGIGQGKRRFMEQEHGSAVALMREVKQAVDPGGIMNPGKIF
ncbi:FAD-linked oxidase C-terminal domain-containing protein [uncultured Roseibium sp.]|uniref:FAD-binding oxidoreductase n=1 Tax=uncultured Roseibium sp. TaxID=1936171 RepID=UPI0032167074